MVVPISATHPATTEDLATATHQNASSAHHISELIFHTLHLTSSLVVLGLVAYFISHAIGSDHEPFWVALAIMDILVCIFALYRAVRTPDMTDLAVAMFTLSGLWLAAFVLAVSRYHKSACGASGHDGLDNPDNCTLKKMHIAFTFVALLASVIAMLIELSRWKTKRNSAQPVVKYQQYEDSDVPVTPTALHTVA